MTVSRTRSPVPRASRRPGRESASRAVREVGFARRQLETILLGLVGLTALIGAWQAMTMTGRFSDLLLPSPAEVARAAARLAEEGTLVEDVLASLRRVSIGYLIAAVSGVTMGVLLGSSRRGAAVFRPVLEVLRPIPGIAWIPLAIVWFGIGDASAYFIVAIASFFPIFVSAHSAITSVDHRYVEMARVLGASQRMQVLEVMLPAALPRVLTGLRVGLGVAWMTVIAAELVAARSGLGYMIQLNRTLLETPAVLVGMALIGLIGFAMSTGIERIERRLTPWARAH